MQSCRQISFEEESLRQPYKNPAFAIFRTYNRKNYYNQIKSKYQEAKDYFVNLRRSISIPADTLASSNLRLEHPDDMDDKMLQHVASDPEGNPDFYRISTRSQQSSYHNSFSNSSPTQFNQSKHYSDSNTAPGKQNHSYRELSNNNHQFNIYSAFQTMHLQQML